jgi:hypothetical protein
MSELNSSSVTAPSPAMLSTISSVAAPFFFFFRPRPPSVRARTLFACAGKGGGLVKGVGNPISRGYEEGLNSARLQFVPDVWPPRSAVWAQFGR